MTTRNSSPVPAPPTASLAPDEHDGYPSLATWIARDPDSETYIFRSFKELTAQNLLYLQSEVIALEDKLNKLDEGIRRDNNPELRQCLRRFETFVERSNDKSATYSVINKRMDLVKEIRNKLKEYHEALLLQTQISGLRQPRDGALNAFRDLFKVDDQTGGQILAGRAKNMLDYEKDLVSLKVPVDRALFARFLRNHWPSKGSDRNTERYSYFLEERVQQAVAVINVVVAAFLLIGAIFSLYYIRQPAVRLSLLAIFTILFLLSIILFTTANRAEVFAATAAYAAVLVVFVSGDFAKNT